MVVVFFGHPGAGKTTLTQRFGQLFGVPGIDTDRFMTLAEREAVHHGRYTQAMRLANIERYCEAVRRDYPPDQLVALADGLPNNAARRFLLAQFPPGQAALVLVQTERQLWERRLSARADNPVSITVAGALEYVRANWEPVAGDIPHHVIENGEDASALDAQLRALQARLAGRPPSSGM